jgi:hypothetical protein
MHRLAPSKASGFPRRARCSSRGCQRRPYELDGLGPLDRPKSKKMRSGGGPMKLLQREICALASVRRHIRNYSAGSTGGHTHRARATGNLSQEARILAVCGSSLSRARVLGRYAFAHVIFHGRRSFRLPSDSPGRVPICERTGSHGSQRPACSSRTPGE